MIEIASLIYLLIPPLIFAIGWLRPVYACFVAVPLAIAGAYTLREMFREQKRHPLLKQHSYAKILVILVLLFLWVIFSGVGGFIWQNRWDHMFRNAVFMDLVNRPWPVMQGDSALCYYLGFWLPSALIGKVFGLQIGYLFQVIWAYIGVVLAVFLIFKYIGAVKIRIILLFIFYSGLDVLVYYAKGLIDQQNLISLTMRLLSGEHIELLLRYFNSSSNTTLLFWLYNQIIPFWVGFMLILLQKRSQSIIVIFSLLVLYSPFPCVTLCPLIVYMIFRNRNIQLSKFREIMVVLKDNCCVETLCAIPFLVIVGLYYLSNIATGKVRFLGLSPSKILFFSIFFIYEFGLYLAVLHNDNRNDPILGILLVTTAVCSFIVLGNSYDFAWRTCIPLSFYIMLLIAKKLIAIKTGKRLGVCLLVLLCIGAITPAAEMMRTTWGELRVLAGESSARSDALDSVFIKENNECYENFIGNTDSFFFSYLCKNRHEQI